MSEADRGAGAAMRLVVVGGGFTGAALVVHAIRASAGRLDIVVVEPAAELGRGIAYGTEDPAHRINVPTDRMGLFKDDPGHATRWFHEHAILPDPASDGGDGNFYVPRQAYGSFISDVLRQTLNAGAGRVTLRHLRTTASALTRCGAAWRASLADGGHVDADIVALCFGHAVPSLPCPIDDLVREHRKFVPDPWARNGLAAIDPSDSVLVVGTGLTMADVVVSLLETGHRGPLTAVSRRGLLPRAHGAFRTDVDILEGEPSPTTALGLLRLMRRRIRQSGPDLGGWQVLIDALRFKLPLVWGNLPAGEKARVLRRLLPFWEVHRFRIAPQVAAALDDGRKAGALTLERAGLAGLRRDGNRFMATLQRPGGTAETRAFDGVVLCTGPEKNLRANPLIAALLAAGTARLDDIEVGLAVDQQSHVLDPQGRAWPNLLAFGPMTRGSFGEMTGAPDIARHIEFLASDLFGSTCGMKRAQA